MKNKKIKFLAKVLYFDENLGRGVLKREETGEKISITHKNIEEVGFKILFEGEIVEVKIEKGEVKVRRYGVQL